MMYVQNLHNLHPIQCDMIMFHCILFVHIKKSMWEWDAHAKNAQEHIK